jgi:hypothetical protein
LTENLSTSAPWRPIEKEARRPVEIEAIDFEGGPCSLPRRWPLLSPQMPLSTVALRESSTEARSSL